jgi:putative hydrolase of the HAD superfamily
MLFDLDGTLLDRETCVRDCILDQYRRHHDHLSAITSADFLELFRNLDQRGYVPKDVVYRQIGQRLDLSTALTRSLTEDYFTRYANFCVGFEGMAQTLRVLCERGLKLAVVTNGSTAVQTAAIGSLSIHRFFDTIVISETEGVRKPDRRIFDIAQSRLHVSAGSAVFVGDHPETDIRGAQDAGLWTVWKRDEFWGPCPHADAAIDELNELPGAIDRLEDRLP